MKTQDTTGVNVKAFVAAWLGWAFDGLDGYLYSLVAIPFVKEFFNGSADAAKQPAAWVQGAFLLGWALGGAIFGRIGDRFGRSRTLNFTILTYAVFTGLSAFAKSWEMLLVFRFISALGIGGEWAAGSALVSETMHSRHRAWGSALLQTGFQAGMIGAAFTVPLFSAEPRYVFLVGVIPAVLTLWIRYAVPEPEKWKVERQQREMPKISDLFAPELRRTTILALALAATCLTTVWAFLFFSPQIIQALPEYKELTSKAAQTLMIRNVTIEFTLWNVLGNFAASFMAKWIGYRKAFVIYLVASGACFLVGFNHPLTLGSARLWFDLYMFFGSSIFGIFPLYYPLLFPTLLRTTGAGFCYNFGRLIAAAGTLVAGAIAVRAGGPAMAVWYAGFLYIPGVVVALFMPEVGKVDLDDGAPPLEPTESILPSAVQ